MKTIYKYQLSAVHQQTIELPLGSRILSVKSQNDEVVLYALVDPDKATDEEYTILAYGTGHGIDINYPIMNSSIQYYCRMEV